MDSMNLISQKNTLAEYMILSGADNRPPMLDKDLYDSWKSKMELYVQNRENGRMILESVEHGPLIWPTKKYAELSATEKIQADCDLKETNIILQGLPFDIYLLVNHHRVAKDLQDRIQLLMQVHQDAYPQPEYVPQIKYTISIVNQQTHLAEFPQIDSGLAVHVFKKEDDPIDAINKMMSFMLAIVSSSFPTTNNQLRNYLNPRQQETIHNGRVTLQPVQGRQGSFAASTSRTRTSILGTSRNNSGQQRVVKCFNFQGEDLRVAECAVTQTVITHNVAYQADDLDAYDSDCDDFSTAKADTNSFTQQDAMILSVFEQLSHQKAQQIRPMLYDDSVIAKETNVISITDSEETLMLEEESQSKMLLKQSDPMVLEKKVNVKPINYAKLNQLSKDFGKRLVPRRELSDEQALHPITNQSAS
uniref:Integrase, catalytic region, zinc finger, CCHC-type, peptidase aspartic, catalytic n=1 Tax=Tanacetum cinerariifolium TaxID=118510 RepID=A0A6L2NW64_TANCI|nr:hypothetical protein [Tanacetum cinerariifolium]